ncbi:MAG: type II toxin-antitoxin system RelE/ParE family toxin [Kiritimatiellae bacterium]|nr:type II toxin-antitoxin system RelE/ParE family toxin [Kiritimatiellia bacterium]
MTPWTVTVAQPAKDDIRRAIRYIAETLSNPPAAHRLLDELESAILSLSVHPARFRALPVEPWRERGYHGLPVRRYLVVYRVDAETRTVHVARVFHTRKDWNTALNSLP